MRARAQRPGRRQAVRDDGDVAGCAPPARWRTGWSSNRNRSSARRPRSTILAAARPDPGAFHRVRPAPDRRCPARRSASGWRRRRRFARARRFAPARRDRGGPFRWSRRTPWPASRRARSPRAAAARGSCAWRSCCVEPASRSGRGHAGALGQSARVVGEVEERVAVAQEPRRCGPPPHRNRMAGRSAPASWGTRHAPSPRRSLPPESSRRERGRAKLVPARRQRAASRVGSRGVERSRASPRTRASTTRRSPAPKRRCSSARVIDDGRRRGGAAGEHRPPGSAPSSASPPRPARRGNSVRGRAARTCRCSG